MGKANDKEESTKETLKARSKSPLIFISHDSRDAELAEAFSILLSSVSAGVLKSFRSSDRKGSQGIEYGVEWYPELMSKLESASDVVCLLTKRSLDRPWILYEAGVAKGKLGTPVYGIVLGIPLRSANTGPFAQFQNCDDKDESLTKLVMQLVRRIPGAEPSREAILTQVKSCKEQAVKCLERLANGAEMPERLESESSVAKLFEEVKVMFQELSESVERRIEQPSKLRRFGRMHPMIIHDMSRMIGEGPGDPMSLLMLLGFMREDFPWLYEIGIEAYRAAKAGQIDELHDLVKRLQRAEEMIMGGPMIEEMGVDPRAAHMLTHEFIRFLTEFRDRHRRPRKKAARARKSNEN
jgi:hypothetical protein